MQSADAYVQQIPPGSRPPALRSAPLSAEAVKRPPPPGLYVQIADVRSQSDAISTSLELAARMGRARPPFIRGVAVQAVGRAHILMFGGPFSDGVEARVFCATVLASGPCLTRTFAATNVSEAR